MALCAPTSGRGINSGSDPVVGSARRSHAGAAEPPDEVAQGLEAWLRRVVVAQDAVLGLERRQRAVGIAQAEPTIVRDAVVATRGGDRLDRGAEQLGLLDLVPGRT